MKRLIQIAQGWYNLIHSNEEVKQMALQRLQICDRCPHKRQLSSAGKIIMTAVNEESSTFYCGLCGCPLATLTMASMAECKAGKWKSETEQQYYY